MTTALTIAIGLALAAFAAVFHRRYRLTRRRLDELRRDYDQTVNSLQHLFARVAAVEAARAGNEPREPPQFRSRSGEDLFLYELFDGAAAGFYIEAGAFDGFSGSLTFALDALGWDGLLVEPHPELSEQAARNRPRARVVRAALAEHGSEGTARFTALPIGNSFLTDRGDAAAHRTLADQAQHYEVPVTTLDAVLEADPPSRIDLCVFDVEGAERALLDGFTLDRWKPRAMLIEDLGGGSDLPAFLARHGYSQCCWLFSNRLFVRNDDPALLETARRLARHLATRG